MKFASYVAIALFAFGTMQSTSFAQQLTFEPDGTLEREEFVYTKVSAKKDTVVTDTVGDLTVFDRNGGQNIPPVLADLQKVTYSPTEEGWKVTFEIAQEMAQNPNLAVNFFLYADKDGDKSNNAPNGVYRTDSDTTYMILHGTRTKWHSKRWLFDEQTGRWNEQAKKPEFTVSGKEFTLLVPYSELPKENGIRMRAFSLTSDAGVTAVDIVPGKGLPKVLKTERAQGEQQKSEVKTSGGSFGAIFLTVVIAFLAFSLYQWKKKSRS